MRDPSNSRANAALARLIGSIGRGGRLLALEQGRTIRMRSARTRHDPSLQSRPARVAADRFHAGPAGIRDLATGNFVEIDEAPSSAASQPQWHERCAQLELLWHSWLLPLIDHFVTGHGAFEVRPRSAGCARPTGASAMWAVVRGFLECQGLSAGDRRAARFVRTAAGIRIKVGASSNLALGRQPRAPRAARASTRGLGLVFRPPPALAAAIEALDAAVATPRLVALGTRPGAGLSTLLEVVAREARRRGSVPLCPQAVAWPGVLAHAAGRTVVLLVDGCDQPVGAALASLMAAGAHVSAIVGSVAHGEVRATARLEAMSRGELTSCLFLHPEPSARERRRVAVRAAGLPGRARDLWLGATPPGRRREGVEPAAGALLVGDMGATNTSGSAAGSVRVSETGPAYAVPAPSLIPAWAALDAGRIEDARAWFGDVRVGDGGTGSSDAWPEALWGLGLCDLESANVLRAEWYLRAARAALTLAQPLDPARVRAVELSLVRCLCSGRRFLDAGFLLDEAKRVEGEDWRWCRLQARIAASRDGRGAAWWLARALSLAHDADSRLAIHTDLGWTALEAGDLVAALAHVREGLRAGRRGSSRGRRLRWAVLHLAVGLAAAGPVRARDLARRGRRRFHGRAMPALRRQQANQVLAAWGSGHPCRISTQEMAPTSPRQSEEPMLDALRTVLEICRDAEDPSAALRRVCSCMLDRLGAVAVSLHAVPGSRVPLAHAGPARLWSVPLLERTLGAARPAKPVPGAAGFEAGAPVVYGGQTIGALLVRWAIDRATDEAQAEAVLVAAATALAPLVQARLDAARPAPVDDDLLGVLGQGPAAATLRTAIRRAAPAPFPVLIEGESGSGKELVARALHRSGPRARNRFCALNCAALSDDLVEAELFGHGRGAFTGAVGERVGLFEEADGGTLFLDEVGELSPRAQAKLLRAIQDGEIRRVGENLPRRTDARVVAATNRSLQREAAEGRFRSDLLYRLDVVRIVVPPLRDRPEDVALLARAFWREAAARVGSRAALHPDTLAALARYDWPGNVRELQNVLMALAVNAPPRGVVTPSRLPAAIAAPASGAVATSLDAARRSFEQRFVRAALARAGHRPGRAARDLGVTRQGLRKLLVRLEITPAPVMARKVPPRTVSGDDPQTADGRVRLVVARPCDGDGGGGGESLRATLAAAPAARGR